MDDKTMLANLKAYAMKGGRAVARQLVALYYVMMAPSTSKKDKVLVTAALTYVVMPFSLISRAKHPILGLMDEAAAIAFAYKRVQKSITPEINQQIEQTLNSWFGNTTTCTSAL